MSPLQVARKSSHEKARCLYTGKCCIWRGAAAWLPIELRVRRQPKNWQSSTTPVGIQLNSSHCLESRPLKLLKVRLFLLLKALWKNLPRRRLCRRLLAKILKLCELAAAVNCSYCVRSVKQKRLCNIGAGPNVFALSSCAVTFVAVDRSFRVWSFKSQCRRIRIVGHC